MSEHSCSLCALSQICLPLGIDKPDLERLEALIKTSKTQHAKDVIVRQSEPFTKIYAVKAGTFKSYRNDENGNMRIIAFHLPGELFGLDAIYPEHYTCTTEALDTAVLCEMDFNQLSELCNHLPTLQKQLIRLLSRDIHVSQISQAENTEQTAEQKLASFIHNLSVRYELRGYSGTQFNLAMSRQDIANYLGLTPETVSRLLKRLRQQDIVEIQNRQLNVLDLQALHNIINCLGNEAA